MLLYSVDASVPFADTQKVIDQVAENGKWLILVFHHVNEEGRDQNVQANSSGKSLIM